MNRNLNGLRAIFSMAGAWTPNGASDPATHNSISVANVFYAPITLANGRTGFILDGWSYSGFGQTQTFYPVSAALLEQNAAGTVVLATEKYLPDATTNGAGAVVVADFNRDGRQDIFLGAHNESPFVVKSSTAYLSNSRGGFDKVVLDDLVEAHHSNLADIGGVPTVFTASFDGIPSPFYQYTNGKFVVTPTASTGTGRTAQGFPMSVIAGANSIVVADFNGDGTPEAAIGDLVFGPGYAFVPGKAPTIGIYALGDITTPNPSGRPEAVLTPYFNDKSQYASISSFHGPGQTDVPRLWTDDFNHDGKLDILASASLWPESVSKLQMFQNASNGNLTSFVDKTDAFAGAYQVNSQAVDYSMQIVDTDGSGINSYLLAGSLNLGSNSEQNNYILLNDGTGTLYPYMHSEFQIIGDQVTAYVAALTGVQYNFQPRFIELVLPDHTINLVAEVPIYASTVSGFVLQHAFVNVPLRLNPAIDYADNISIADRNGSTLIRTWAGNDMIASTNASSRPTSIDGGAGTDTSIYSGAASKYKLTFTAGVTTFTVEGRTGDIGTDTLANVERVQFADMTLDATPFTKTAALTKAQVDSLTEVYIASFNRAPDALGLDYWGGRHKDGMSLEAIAKSFFTQPETTAKYPASTSNESFVSTVYGNVLGRSPDADGLKYWTGELANGHITRDTFLLAILNGAHANRGAAQDIANLNNKVAVGEYFALAKGLNNGTWSHQVMAGVTSSASTVTTANAMTDNFATVAEASATSELVVKILGIVA